MTIIPVELYGLGKYGVIADTKPHLLPPEAWNDANNVVFDSNGARPAGGHSQVFGTMSVAPEFIMNVPALGASYWIYCSLAAAYVYESGSHSNITNTLGAYTAANGRDWNGTLLGGVPILNNGSDLPQYWPAFNPATLLVDLPNFQTPAAATLRAKVIRAFGQYLVALNITDNGNRLQSTIQWSSKADPGSVPASWDYTDPTVAAGRTHLTDAKGGDIQDAYMLGDELIIYKDYATHALRLVGGVDVMRPRLLLSTSGILAPRCACSFKKGTGHFVATDNDIIIHQGTREAESIAKDRVQNKIFSEIDSTNYLNAFCFENVLKQEVWFCYPTTGNTYPNKAARWSYRYNTWTFRDFTGVSADYGSITDASGDTWDSDTEIWDSKVETWSTESRIQQVFVDRVKAFKLDSGYSFDGVVPSSYLERIGIAIDSKDREGKPKASQTSRKLLSRIWPKLTGSDIVQVRCGKQELLDGPVTWDSLQMFDPQTQRFLDSSSDPVNGLLLAVRYEADNSNSWQLEGHDLYVARVSGL